MSNEVKKWRNRPAIVWLIALLWLTLLILVTLRLLMPGAHQWLLVLPLAAFGFVTGALLVVCHQSASRVYTFLQQAIRPKRNPDRSGVDRLVCLIVGCDTACPSLLSTLAAHLEDSSLIEARSLDLARTYLIWAEQMEVTVRLIILVNGDKPQAGWHDLSRQIRSSRRLRSSKIIALSSSSGVQALADAYRAGADACLPKPTTRTEVLSVVDSLMRLR